MSITHWNGIYETYPTDIFNNIYQLKLFLERNKGPTGPSGGTTLGFTGPTGIQGNIGITGFTGIFGGYLEDGTESDPSLYFINYPSTGIYNYFDGSNSSLNITCAGNTVTEFNSTTGISSFVTLTNCTGSAINPSYSSYSYPNSGLYNNSTGMSISVNSQLVSTFSATGQYVYNNLNLITGTNSDLSFNFDVGFNTGIYMPVLDTIGIVCNNNLVSAYSATGHTTSYPVICSTGTNEYPTLSYGVKNYGINATSDGNVDIVINEQSTASLSSLFHTSRTQIQNTTGSASFPSYSFETYFGSGVYLSETPTIAVRITSNGSNMAEYSSVTSETCYDMIGNSAGSVSNPSYSFQSSTGSGIYNPSNSTIGFTSNGISKGLIDTTGLIQTNRACIYYFNSSTQNIANADTTLTFDTSYYNVGPFVVTSNTTFTIPLTGIYKLLLNISFENDGTGVRRLAGITRNGTIMVYNQDYNTDSFSSGGLRIYVQVKYIGLLSSGNTITFIANSNNAGGVNIGASGNQYNVNVTKMSITYLGN
jgi:hypothetical protein